MYTVFASTSQRNSFFQGPGSQGAWVQINASKPYVCVANSNPDSVHIIAVQSVPLIMDISAVFSKAIGNLLRTRKHLALMLDFEWGNVSQKKFEQEEEKYLLETETRPLNSIIKEVSLLLDLYGMPLDSEEISGMLNCSISDAEKAIQDYCRASLQSASPQLNGDVS